MTKHCETCTNANTPICENCTFIENSKGIDTPSEYVGYDPSIADEVCIGDLAALIEHRITNHLPIHNKKQMCTICVTSASFILPTHAPTGGISVSRKGAAFILMIL